MSIHLRLPGQRRRPVRLRATADLACTPLELLFDLCFVVAVGAMVVQLHHATVDGRMLEGAWRYLLMFVPLCRSWALFCWYVNAFDCDDLTHRLLTFAQMAGVLVLTATVPDGFAGDLRPFVACYVLMRLPLALTWARAAAGTGAGRRYAQRATAGIVAGQVGWAAVLLVPAGPGTGGLIAALVLGEIALAPWAMAAASNEVFHARHLSERFGLFTMIVIGESVLAAAAALERPLAHHVTGPLVGIACATLVSALCVWWLYFGVTAAAGTTQGTVDRSHALAWEHGHLMAFATIGAMGAVAEVAVEVEVHSGLLALPLRLAVVAPAALSLVALARIAALTGGGRFEPVARCAVAAVLLGTCLLVERPLLASAATAVALLLQVVAETVLRCRHLCAADGADRGAWWSAVRPRLRLRLIQRRGCGTSAHRFRPWLPLARPA